MKTATFNTFFKLTTADKEAGKTVKRPDLVVTYSAVESADLDTFNPTQITAILNQNLESYAKRLITANKDNWDYSPVPADITIDNLYAEMTAESSRGKRLITKDSLKQFAEYYFEASQLLLAKSIQAAKNGAIVIESKCEKLISNKAALANFMDNLSNLATHEEFDSNYENICVALIELISDALAVEEIVADDL